MPLCAHCASFEEPPPVGQAIALPNYGQLDENASLGCGGCRFFRDALRIQVSDSPEIDPRVLGPEASVSLCDVWRQVYCELSCNNPELGSSVSARISPSHNAPFEEDFAVPEDPLDDHCFLRVHSWLRDCMKHGCASQADNPLPRRVIEVSDNENIPPRLFLPPTGMTSPFVALTHCWGNSAEMTKLLTKNVTAWQDGIDAAILKRNFQDALVITRRLGMRYIWIDALCIIQDSAEDWIEQSPQMASIYGSATLVISATSVADSNDGILRLRPALCSPLLGASPRNTYYVADKNVVGDNVWRKEPPLTVIGRSPLNSRAWCAQERILATRILHYTQFEMIWECASACCLESTRPVAGEEGFVSHSSHNIMPFKKANLQSLIDRWHKHQHDGTKEHDNSAELDKVLRIWFECVQEYSPRQLTYSTDKLPAMAGLADVFSTSLHNAGTYLAGIWGEHVGRCLAWHCALAGSHRPVAYRAPSWSWASVDGQIYYSWKQSAKTSHSSVGSNPWPRQHNPRLVDQKMVLEGESSPYMGVKEGSFILLDGSCMDARTLETLSFDPDCKIYIDVADGRWFRGLNSGRPLFENSSEEILLMQLQWEWERSYATQGVVICGLLIHGMAAESTFRRLGLAVFTIRRQVGYVDGEFKTPMDLQETFHSLLWRRRTLVLI